MDIKNRSWFCVIFFLKTEKRKYHFVLNKVIVSKQKGKDKTKTKRCVYLAEGLYILQRFLNIVGGLWRRDLEQRILYMI